MIQLKLLKIYTALITCLLTTNLCLGKSTLSNASDIIFVGSTPGDSLMKSLLAIPNETKIDFIRWHLTFKNSENNQNTFVLDIVYGESQPNTSGFKGGGEKRSFEGIYSVSKKTNSFLIGDVFQLKNDKSAFSLSLVKLNDNLFHLLTPNNQLIVGNGGWSYTLNRKELLPNISTTLPILTSSSSLLSDTALQVIFDGRTPCQDFAKVHNLTVRDDCFKLKWRVILNRDPKTLLPTTYQLKGITRQVIEIEGKWSIIKGTALNSNALIYQLDPDIPEKTISLLVGDENVLFILNKDRQLFVGNSDFSYTLNKKK